MSERDPSLEDLFAEARRDVGTETEMARVRARLAASGGSGAPATRTGSWVALAVVIVIASGVALLWLRRDVGSTVAVRLSAAPTSRGGASSETTATRPAELPSPAAIPEPAPSNGAPTDAPARATPSAPTRGDATSGPPSRATKSRPARPIDATTPTELELVREARAALATAPARTLELTQHATRLYPDGVLAPEREVLAIDALARLGRASSARARARAVVSS